MPSSYSTNLKIELQATGENSGTWGTITNTNLGTALEQAIVGYGNPNYASDANLTLTYTDTNAAQAARALVLNVTSGVSLTGTRELVVPTIQKQYIVQNNTTGSQSITVKTSAGTGITVPNGRKAHLYVNGTDVIFMDDFVDINGGAIDGTTIGANSAAAGTFTTVGATTGNITTVNATTVDTTNIEVTNLKAKDGTAAGSIADSTGVVTLGSSVLTTTDINGGTIDGTTIGGSSAAAGTFTTLTTSSTVTLNGGTANGVLYLNGSKVATSGSALVFDGTNLGIGTISPSKKLDVRTSASGEAAIGTFSNDSTAAGTNVASLEFASSGVAKASIAAAVYGDGWMSFRNNDNTEKMHLTASGNLGLGVTPSAWGSDWKAIQVGSNGAYLTGRVSSRVLYLGTNNYYDGSNFKYTGTAAASLYTQDTGAHQWFNAPSGTAGNTISFTQAMTLDASGNLGVGITSPTARLHLKGPAGSNPNTNGVVFQASGSTSNFGAIGLDNSSGDFVVASGSGAALRFYTNSDLATTNERARITSGGDFGIGTTSPDIYSFGSSGRYLTVQAQSGTTFSLMQLVSDGTNSGGVTFGNATIRRASIDGLNGSALTFSTNGTNSGTTVTERARINSDGDVIIGSTVAPVGNGLAVNSGVSSSSVTAIEIQQNTTGAVKAAAAFGVSIQNSGEATNAADLFFSTASGGSLGERARITSGGDFGIGTTSPLSVTGSTYGWRVAQLYGSGDAAFVINGNNGAGRLHLVAGGASANQKSWGIQSFGGSLIFASINDALGETERARITSGGEFLVGTTSSSSRQIYFKGGAVSTFFATFEHTNTDPAGLQLQYSGAAPNGTGNVFLSCFDTGGTRANIRSNGGLANYQSNNVDLSDSRTKNSITPAASMWDKIGALEIVTYKYNDQTHDDVNVGVIAQQVESVEPVWVDNDGFGETPEGEEPLKTVYTKDITFAAIKALQEAMARIEKLEAEMAALKGA